MQKIIAFIGAIMCLLIVPGMVSADSPSLHDIRVVDSGTASSPILGADGISTIVVYTDQGFDPDNGLPEPGKIRAIRIDRDSVINEDPIGVSVDSTDNYVHDISGPRIVYTAYEDVLSQIGQIKVLDSSSGENVALSEFSILHDAGIHGDKVAWIQEEQDSTQVMLVDLSMGASPTRISTPETEPAKSLAVGDRFVVWAIGDDIVAYDLASRRLGYVANQLDRVERYPSTSGSWIVWEETALLDDATRIKARNMDTANPPVVVVDDGATNLAPTIDGALIAYESNANGDFNIYIYRLTEGDTFCITCLEGETTDERLNSIYGNQVAYQDQKDMWVTTLTVEDTTLPVLTAPADVTIECSQDSGPAITGFATATDDCDGVPEITFIDSDTAGACSQESVITRTWTATDACGNTSSVDQTITIEDNTAPVLTLPADVTIGITGDSSPGTTGAATATDGCDGAPAVSFSDRIATGPLPGEAVITRSWTATDACGNSASDDQVITVADETPPVLTLPADATVECDADSSSAATGVATATDDSDGVTITESDSVAAGACAQERVIIRTWTARDAWGNAVSDDQIITVVDTTAPSISIPADTTIECLDDSSPASNGSATATDTCDVSPVIAFTDEVAAGACAQESVITRTWTATDACGNSSSAVQTITIVDTTTPEITAPADVTIECSEGSSSEATGSATATDDCDVSPVITFIDSDTAGACSQESVITRTWTATDACGNASSAVQTITIVDTTAPVLDLPLDQTIGLTEDRSTGSTGAATATDGCDVAPSVSFSDSVVTGRFPGEAVITRTWTATDACGNTASADQIITIADNDAPELTLPTDATVECDEDSSPAGTGVATATDDSGQTPTITFSDSDAAGSCPQESVITRTWTATDACGNATSADQIITIVDTTNPVLTVPPDATLEFDSNNSPSAIGMATATDNCDSSPQIANDAPEFFSPGDTVVTWTVTDGCGNTESGQQNVTVADTTPPIAVCRDITVQLDAGGNASITAADVDGGSSDAAGIASLAVSQTAFTAADLGANTVTLTVTDVNGNSSSCTATVTVEDNVPPVALCKDITVKLDSGGNASITAADVDGGSTDNVGIASLTVSPNSFNTDNLGPNTVTLTVTDVSGNTSTCTAVVTVEGGAPPETEVNTICAVLGDDRSPSRLDQDIFTFQGIEGQTVTVRVAADPSKAGKGKRLFVLLKDLIRGVRVVKIGKGTLPNEFTLTLPASGKYLILASERFRFGKRKRYQGPYCISLVASPDIARSLRTTRWVE